MRFSTAARLLALLGMLAQSVPGQARERVEDERAASGSKPAAKPPAKSKAKRKPRPKPVARKASSKPAKKSAAPPAASAPAAPAEAEPALAASPSPSPAASATSEAATAPPRPPPAPATAAAGHELPAAPSSAAATRYPPPPAAALAASGEGSASGLESSARPAKAPSSGTEGNGPTPLQLALFVDAYASWQSSGDGTLATLSNHRAFSGQGSNLRAENGFGLAFLGLDASYATPHVGVTANLRFGEGAPLYHFRSSGESDAAFGVEWLTQAYLTWRPWQVLALDLGMFNTPFGAEVLESWKNLNYTRGALYYYAQPAWHSGLRLQWDPTETLALVSFVANGSNIISETQQDAGLSQTPTLGAQLGWTPSSALWLAAGGLFTTDGYDNDDSGFDALGDVILRFEQGRVLAELNASYVLTRNGAPDGSDRHLLGASAGAGYTFSELFRAAARGEWLSDDANFDQGERDRWRLFTVTLTADVRPIAAAPHLIVRWDNRWEESNQQVFGKDARRTADPADDSYADVWFQSVLGVVLTTAP